MSALSITCDRNSDLKRLRRLELSGAVELHGVAIEGIEDTKKIGRKELPIGIIDGTFSTFGNCVFAASDTPYKAIEKIIGRHNHGDVLHLERHINSGRDIFVTDDNDFLKHREELMRRFGARIMTVDELEAEIG